jgi:cytoskeletal protein RodZ
VYDNWYQRAKEALTPTPTTTLIGRRARYQFSIEEKTKKNTDDDTAEEEVFELVWRFSENDDENANEESREEDTKKKRKEMVMMRGSCKMKRVVAAAARAAEGVETGSAKETATTVLLELLRHASLKYIREKEGNVDLKRANECLRKDQEIAVKEELEKARDIEQFKRKCFEECLVLVNEKKKRIRELEEILETARKENDALSKKIGKGKGGKKRGRSSSSEESSSSEASSSSEEVSDEDEEEEANTDDEDKATQIRKRMRQTAMVDTIKTTSDGRKKPSAKPTTTKTTKATKATASQKSKPAARRVNTFDALMQANLGRDSDANSQSSSF